MTLFAIIITLGKFQLELLRANFYSSTAHLYINLLWSLLLEAVDELRTQSSTRYNYSSTDPSGGLVVKSETTTYDYIYRQKVPGCHQDW